ncbi:pantothenate kinase [Synchytrium endobioticum]|uniref:pantothenate kinase n=1 Tax=Synchytrium endobioticum TaxID=286115 RepID=A0A507D1U9_9FUNG|nr:pantothenate kinase [Synchytrium endobioticum]
MADEADMSAPERERRGSVGDTSGQRRFGLNIKGAAISQDPAGQTETREILFPHQTQSVAQIAVDIGGSLAKVVWFSKAPNTPGGRLNFVKFQTEDIEQCVEFIRRVLDEDDDLHMPRSQRVIKATGGGAHKYYDKFQEQLGVTVQKEDEMECLIIGLNFMVRQISYEVFTYDERRPEPLQYEDTPRELFPYMLVNIGSGVSILKVTSEETYERISGTSLGGGTLWGLLALITNGTSYDEMLELSKLGDNKNVDMLVGDIYGGDYLKIGLKATTIASSFGKVFKASPAERYKFRPEDISRSLLYMVSNNIGQIAYLNAQAHGLQRIYFSGMFIRGHPITMNTLSFAISFWSKGKIKALFCRHEGYLGAVGAFLRLTPRKTRLGSFRENFSQIEKISEKSLAVGVLDKTLNKETPFPLLSEVALYNPDTTDLNDPKLQKYWIHLLDKNLSDLTEMALEWQGHQEDSKQRAATFESMYRAHLQRLSKEPTIYGVMTVRSLLDLREQCLHEMGFRDIFEGIKKQENAAALEGLPNVLRKLDQLLEGHRIETLIQNVLAGNMYDWGSTSVQEMLRRGELDFETAKLKVQHPPKFNQLEEFKTRLLRAPPHHKSIVFVDNSGADFILGIIPFARYLLSKGTRVVLACNTFPSVNDMTAEEGVDLIEKISMSDSIIKENWANGMLQVIGSGSGSPCLDLTRINEQLAREAVDCDLVVLEGMGRAIHTNFFAKFRVESLKIAVFKNVQIAEALGASMYDAIVLYSAGDTYQASMPENNVI